MEYASLLLLLLMQLVNVRRAGGAEKHPWASFVETSFPFFSSVVDARKLGSGWSLTTTNGMAFADNAYFTPRALVP